MLTMPDALVILGFLATITTAVLKLVPRREASTSVLSNGSAKYVHKDVCEAVMRRVEQDLAELKADVKRLLAHAAVGRRDAVEEG